MIIIVLELSDRGDVFHVGAVSLVRGAQFQ